MAMAYDCCCRFIINHSHCSLVLLIPHPQDVGIFVEEMTEKELLIASATDKEVYNNVIRQSVASPEEIKNQVRLST